MKTLSDIYREYNKVSPLDYYCSYNPILSDYSYTLSELVFMRINEYSWRGYSFIKNNRKPVLKQTRSNFTLWDSTNGRNILSAKANRLNCLNPPLSKITRSL